MPKFFIQFRNANKVVAREEIGIDVPGVEQARAAAVTSAREKLADDIKLGTKTPLEAVIITDERGRKWRIQLRHLLPESLK